MQLEKKRINELLNAIEVSHSALVDISPNKEIGGEELEYLTENGFITGATVLRGGLGNKVLSTQTDKVEILKQI